MKTVKFLLIVIFSVVFTNNQLLAQENTNLITPPYLQKGDTIAIVAPAGKLTTRKDVIDKATKVTNKVLHPEPEKKASENVDKKR